MPIFVREFSWHQTNGNIILNIPLKNVQRKDIDFSIAKQYVKANYYPYIFEIFLFNSINKLNSKCYIKDNEIILELCKTESGFWDHLEAEIDKAEKVELRKKYLEEIQNETQMALKEKVNKKAELKRVAVRGQIEIDTKFRQAIEKVKKEETERALQELKLLEDTRDQFIKNTTEHKSSISPEKKPAKKENSTKIFTPKKNSQPAIPMPRKCQSVNISFTAREFPTPSRESKSQEEQEWLTKQAEAKRAAGFDDDDLRPEERNPQWLKDKGDEFFKAKNYLAAINAYTTGIKISKNYVSLYINRSAAHFAMDHLHKTIDDCTTAIEIMTPVCEANRILRAKCIARRGAALCKLGLWREGRIEIEAALKLVPDNEKLRQDLKNIESKYEFISDIIGN